MNKSIFKITENDFENLVNITFNADNTNKLLQIWNNSLKINKPDFSVYGSDDYFYELWLCWKIYSKKYVKSITNILNNKFKTIVDLGCGMGFTTVAFRELYPKSIIYGTNIKKTKQWDFCKKLAIDYNFNMVESIEKINDNIDLLFASEYFEHIINPIEHIMNIINRLNPNIIVIANSFNTDAIGHFKLYKVTHNDYITSDKIGRLFNNTVKLHGYTKMKTSLWNNRPNIWIKNTVKNNKPF